MKHLFVAIGVALMVAVMLPGVGLVQWAMNKSAALGLAAFLAVVGADIGVVYAFAATVS